MRGFVKNSVIVLVFVAMFLTVAVPTQAKVKIYEGTITIPTYEWKDDINPKFWALEGAAKGSFTVKESITYPYTMQDHLYRTKVDRTYRAVYLENEYLKITCLPELGGRFHSVLDKTEGKEMFHRNNVIKPSMIAMRGAFISGGAEWNAGPHVHTVTILSPVNVISGQNPDGSAYLEISNLEKSLRTRWTVHVTLHPGKAYLDEQIRIFNPTDGMQPYYFWNCTAFPCKKATRFIYPINLGTDHYGRRFYSWPVRNGKDMSWLKNYETASSVFAYQCAFDFFGAYDVDDDRGVVQVADRYELGGKKAWTWGQGPYGRVCQSNLADDGSGYIEVQSGPLPTQSDYGMLGPREDISWCEWWYPVHGLGDGFEYATKDLVVQSRRSDGALELRLLATGKFDDAVCTLSVAKQSLVEKTLDLSSEKPQLLMVPASKDLPVNVTVTTKAGDVLASFATPLNIPQIEEPDRSIFVEKDDEKLTLEEKYLRGLKCDRATDRLNARKYYEMALAEDPGYSPALRGLAILDVEAGLYETAARRLEKALNRNGEDGLAWYFLSISCLKMGNQQKALRCAHTAATCFGCLSLGNDLAGRAYMQQAEYAKAVNSFEKAVYSNPRDSMAKNHLLLALYAMGDMKAALEQAEQQILQRPTDPIPRAVVALQNEKNLQRFVRDARDFLGEHDFEMLDATLVFVDMGLFKEAQKLLSAVCIEAVPENQVNPLTLYYLAYFAHRSADDQAAKRYLQQAGSIYKDFVFACRTQAEPVLKYALEKNPNDAYAHYHIGNLYGNFNRLDEAVEDWQKAVELDPSLSVAFRNLGLHSWIAAKNLTKAADYYTKAIAARPGDQTLYRDLAEILIANDRRREAIAIMEQVPFERQRRSDITIPLAQAYLDEEMYDETIELLESTPYFVNWEGSSVVWQIFNRAHLLRGQQRFDSRDFKGALEDFEAALTYPENLGVGVDFKQDAPAYYWKGKALEALGRLDEARSAWQKGADAPEGRRWRRSSEQNTHRQLCSMALVMTK